MAITPAAPIYDPNFVATSQNFIDAYTYAIQYDPSILSVIQPSYNSGYYEKLLANNQVEKVYSDIFYWQQFGRERIVYTGVTKATNAYSSGAGSSLDGHLLQVDDVLISTDGTNTDDLLVTAVTANGFTGVPVGGAAATVADGAAIEIRRKRNDKLQGSSPINGRSIDFDQYSNTHFITRADYDITGTKMEDAIKFTDHTGATRWYHLDLNQQRRQHMTDINFGLLDDREKDGASAIATQQMRHKGMFRQIETNNGNVMDGAGSGVFNALTDVDALIDQLNAQSGEKSNHIYGNLDLVGQLDNLLSDVTKPSAGGAYYGDFMNGVKKVDLGFKEFTRKGYNFFYAAEDVLNDPTLLGGVAKKPVGWLEPVGMTNINDGNGAKQTVNYMTVCQKGDRFMKPATNGYSENSVDEQRFSLISEMGTRLVRANAFVLFKD